MRVVHSNEPAPAAILGKVVATLRDLRGWSQADLASYAKKHSKQSISAKTVTNIEAGTHLPTAGKLIAIADAFGVEPWQLFIPLPDELDEKGMEIYLRDQAKMARYFRKAPPGGRESILRIARLEQDAKLSEAV